MELKFRNLTSDEIECKPTIIGNKIEISLHIKASTCTKLLNETVGPMDWEKEYTNGNKNCIVRIWDKDKNRMISKEDCGGSLTEIDGYKGQASNGFKRVCALGWGLGMELYSQPKIFVQKDDSNVVYDAKDKEVVVEHYYVKEIEYKADSDGNQTKTISRVVVVDSDNNIVYDGPNENGVSNVTYIKPKETVVVPEDADIINSESEHDSKVDVEDDDVLDLPDNTDGYDDVDECEPQPMPFGNKDYRKDIEAEIARTHVKKDDVLKVLGIQSFGDLKLVDEGLIETTIKKLRAMKTYEK